jgi:predicted phage terminase large subunit-like protein
VAKKPVAPKVVAAPAGPTPAEQLAAAERQEKIIRRLIAAKKSHADLLEFTKFTMPDPEDLDDPQLSRYKPARHHEIIAAALQEVEAGRILRLAISVFPQSGKSELASRRFPAWYMGRNPEKNLMFGTYSQDFGEKFGAQVRSIIDRPNYRQVFPKVHLEDGSKSRSKMTIAEYGGSLLVLGRGGMGSGNPASLFVIDDPIKDAKEAQSATIRDDVWDWYTHVVEARCNVFSAQIIIQTRWHEDDLIGRLTDPNNPHYHPLVAAQWKVINIPAIIQDEELATIMGKSVGDPLWPERFPLETLAVKQALDPVAFSALYMGKPTPPDGVFFKADDLLTYGPDEMPKVYRPYMSGDLALGTSKQNDHSCVGKWMLDENDNLYLHPNLYWDRKKADESVEKIIDMMLDFQPMDTWWEKGQIDKAVGPFFYKRASERQCYHSITALPVAGDKGFRASAARGRMRMGKLLFPRHAPWWPRAKDQLLKFTGSGDDMEDDFVDMVSIIGQALGKQMKMHAPAPNVIDFPKTGTMAWIKQADRMERRERERLAKRRGF